MCKSSALGFVLIFAFLFRLEKPSWRLVFIISIMTVGVVMMVAGETAFHAFHSCHGVCVLIRLQVVADTDPPTAQSRDREPVLLDILPCACYVL
jgi:hypothetical protein